MHNLYDLGYSEITPDMLKLVAKTLNAIVVDARISPRSRNPGWRQGALENLLHENYTHVKALGNVNYKGGPVEIVDLEAGMKVLNQILLSQPVIIICVCKDRERCHRFNVVTEFEKEYGVKSIPLHKKDCLEILGQSGETNEQLTLF